MSSRKIVAVVGATGAQGNGLVRAILADPAGGFAVRALTRDPGSPAARSLTTLGADVVAADLDDPASLARAFDGAWGAYCVTFFWHHFSPGRELAQAAAMAAAAAAAGLQHVIWSTLEDSRRFVPLDDPRMPTLMDRYKVPHFDAKGEADPLFLESGVPTTFLLTSFYWDNLINFGMAPTKGPDGRWHFVLPMDDAKLPGIAAEDIGRCAYGIFRRGGELAGRTIGIAGEHLSGAEMAATLARVLGLPVVHDSPPPERYRQFGFPGAEDLGNMFQFNRDFSAGFRAARSVEATRALHPGLQTFEGWVARNRDRIPLGG